MSRSLRVSHLRIATAIVGTLAWHSFALAQPAGGATASDLSQPSTPTVPAAPAGVEASPDAAAAPVANPAATDASGTEGTTVGQNENDIVITATRRTEKLENVPASVLAVTGAGLEKAGVTKFSDLAAVAPGVQIARSGTYTQPAIRGVSTTFAGGGQETNVSVYVDGFYNSDQMSINQDFSNIQDIQVLKGPQGTLYGRNSTGGALLITTRSPTDRFQADGSVSYAPRFDDKQANIFIGGPIANGIKASIAANWHESDGWFKDVNGFAKGVQLDPTTYDFGGKLPAINFARMADRSGRNTAPFKNWSIRPKLVLEPADGVKVTLGYVHNYVSDAKNFAYLGTGEYANPADGYDASGTACAPGAPGCYEVVRNRKDKTSLNYRPISAIKSDEVNATVELKLGSIGTLTSRTAYRKQRDFQMYDLDATPRDPAQGFTSAYGSIQRNRRKTFTQQLDYSGQFGPLNLLAGLFYYNDRFFAYGYQDVGTASNPVGYTTNFKTQAWAAYLDATYNISDKLFITAGARYSHDQKQLVVWRYDVNGDLITSSSAYSTICYTGGTNSVYDPTCTSDREKKISKNAWTPHIVLRYNIDRGTNVYASISRGFKAGTINTGNPFNALKPETVTAYEVGVKTAQGGFRAEGAAFFYNYKNNQVSAFNGQTTVIRNSGGAHIYGIDASASYKFPDAPLNIRAGLTWLHARYTDFGNAVNNTAVGGVNTNVIGSWTGRRLIRAPDWSGSFGADYTFDNVFGGKLLASGTASFSSRYAPQTASYQCAVAGRALDSNGNPTGPYLAYGTPGTVGVCAEGTNKKKKGRWEENGYLMLNAQLAWTDPSDHYTLTLFANNLTNTRVKFSGSQNGYLSYDVYGEPRTVGVKAGFKF
jgi:iron complex outermembrane receptor protein